MSVGAPNHLAFQEKTGNTANLTCFSVSAICTVSMPERRGFDTNAHKNLSLGNIPDTSGSSFNSSVQMGVLSKNESLTTVRRKRTESFDTHFFARTNCVITFVLSPNRTNIPSPANKDPSAHGVISTTMSCTGNLRNR